MKKNNMSRCFAAALIALSLTAPITAHSSATPRINTWKFSLPADAPYANCTITFYADNRVLSAEKTVNRGSSASWSAPKPLSLIFGTCGNYFMIGQYCDGAQVSSSGTHACNYDVNVKFCPKVANPSPNYSAQYGFCPE